MSLINEALRRARQEGTIKEHEHGHRSGPPRNNQTGGSRLGTGLVLGAIIAIAAAGFGAIVAFWLLRPTETTPAQSSIAEITSQAVAEDTPTLSTDDKPDRPGQSDLSRELGSPTVTDSTSIEQPARPPAAQREEQESNVSQPTPPRPLASDLREQPLQDRETGSSTPEQDPKTRDFIAEADLGYVRLRLDYIVFRATDPFAEINGLEVHEGSKLHGFTVEKIEKNLVLLRDDRGSLTLRVR
jgi:hypothetical protein